jgi:preprotein translocase subunit YajC
LLPGKRALDVLGKSTKGNQRGQIKMTQLAMVLLVVMAIFAFAMERRGRPRQSSFSRRKMTR